MRWTWDPRKDRLNRRDHGLGFETAMLVFDGILAASKPDLSADEERWQTMGMVRNVVIFVVHTWPELDESGKKTGRLISARRATRHERKAYEEGEF